MVMGAVVAAAGVSCAKQEELVPEPAVIPETTPTALYRYVFDINEDLTRATLDNEGVFWEAGDMVGVYLKGIGNTDAEIDMDTSPKTVILRSAESIPAGTEAYAYYPFDENNTSLSAVKLNIPHMQVGGISSAMPMAGIPFTVEEGGATSNNGVIWFMNLASIIDFKVYSSTYAGETVKSVTFQVDGTTISGDAILNLGEIDPEEESTLAFSSWSSNRYNYVTVRQNATVSVAKDNATSIYMVLAPGTYASGTITIVTNAATYTFPFSDKAMARNELKHYTMNLNNATRLVTKSLPYAEDFKQGIGSFSTDGVQVNNNDVWKQTNQYGMKATAYYSNAYEAESWLLSPWIDLSSVPNAAVSFEHVHRFTDDPEADLTLWVFTDIPGDTEHQLTIPTYASGSDWNDWKNVEDISLLDYVGHRVRIGFKYSSTVSRAATWEIKSFSVEETVVPVVIVEDSFTWNLAIDETSSASTSLISWSHSDTGTSMSATNGTTTSANNYYPGTPNQSFVSTRFYNGATLTITPGSSITITSVVFTATTSGYANALGSSTWTGASASVNDAVVTVTPSDGQAAFSATVVGTCGFTSVKVNYSYETTGGGGGGVAPTSDLPGHLGCFEIPALSTVSGYAYGDEVLGSTQWYRWNTTNAKQKIVTHTFYNDQVTPNRMMRSYTLLQDYDKKCALWVACAMNNDVYPKTQTRQEKWTWDPALDHDWQPNLSNSYPDKGGYSYDRGHQLAATYRATTSDQIKMTCYYTNMTPQLSTLNQNTWRTQVEAKVYDLGEATTGNDTLYVVSGPLFIGNYGTVEDKSGTSCARPTHYFQCFMKVRFNANGSVASAKGAAYLVEHVATPTVQYKTIDEIESLAGFDFFANVPAVIQNTAEATATPYNNF